MSIVEIALWVLLALAVTGFMCKFLTFQTAVIGILLGLIISRL